MNPETTSLGYLPHIVLGLYLIILMGIGYIGFRRSKLSEEDYYLAGRAQGWFVTSLTIMATFFSSGAMLGVPGQVYKHGAIWVLFALNVPLSGASIYLLGSRIARVGRIKGYITPGDMICDYYRSAWALRLLTVLIGLLYAVPYVVMQIKAGGIIAAQLFEAEHAFAYGASALATITMLYIMAGGMRSVAWTDAIQGLLLIAGMLLGGAAVVWALGGVQGAFTAISELPARTLSAPGTLGEWSPWLMLTVCLYGSIGSLVQPAQWMRFYAARSNAALRRSAMICAVVLSVCFLCGTMLVAMGGGALYPLADEQGAYRFAVDGQSEPVLSADIDGMIAEGATLLPHPEVGDTASEFDQIMMAVMRDQLPAMLGGAGLLLVTLFSVAVMAASMSTADSNLHTLSALLTRDIFDRFIHPGASQTQRAWVGRAVIAIATLVALAMVLISETSTTFNPVQEIGKLMILAIAFSCQLLPVAFDMLYFRRGTRLGAIAGMIAGLVIVFTFTPFASGATESLGLAETLKSLSKHVHAGMWGLMTNTLVFIIVSTFTPRLEEQHIEDFKHMMDNPSPESQPQKNHDAPKP
jgi:SSS family solute:Na+ symporter